MTEVFNLIIAEIYTLIVIAIMFMGVLLKDLSEITQKRR